MKAARTQICVALLALALVSLALGCASPVGYTTQSMHRRDKDTTYRVDDHDSGFSITVYYSRYQFVPESTAVALAGKSALLSIAHDVAESRGRAIDPIDEQRIKMSMGRNGLSGITSWSGSVKVFYKQAAK